MLSNTTRYALRAVIYLAVHSEQTKRIGIKKISEDLNIPSPFLGKILQTLAKHKLLLSTKGPTGGFALPDTSRSLTLFDFVKVLDGDDLFTKCLLSDRNCHEEHIPCPVHEEYHEIRKKIIAMFSGHTIQSFADKAENGEVFI